MLLPLTTIRGLYSTPAGLGDTADTSGDTASGIDLSQFGSALGTTLSTMVPIGNTALPLWALGGLGLFALFLANRIVGTTRSVGSRVTKRATKIKRGFVN